MKIILTLLIVSLLISQQEPRLLMTTMGYSKKHQKNIAALRIKAFESYKEKTANSYFRNLKWENMGPYVMGGRITDIAVPKNSYFTYYIAAASGGVWKTINNGTSFTPIFDHESSITIGDIALSDSDPNIIWVGTGENNSLRSSYAGTGIFKSEDAGKTWQNMGLADSHHIGRIIVHPIDKNIVYVAVIGHLYSRNMERGIYKTIDAGKNWEKVLFINDETGFIDVTFAPDNPNIIYAAAWKRERKAWDFLESGKESGIYKSSDAGKNWNKKTNGFPDDKFVGRIGFATSKVAPNVLYALLDNQRMKAKAKKIDKERMENTSNNVIDSVIVGVEMYRSNDYGDTWKLVSEDFKNTSMYSVYGYFFGNMAVDPNNVDIVYALGIQISKSINGGKNWNIITKETNVHGDHHAIWINPQNSNHIINGNDGGLDLSYDAGKTWQSVQTLAITQFYTVSVDQAIPYYIYGGTQDNGTWKGSSTTPNFENNIMGLSDEYKWKFVSGGDGFYVQVDPTDPSILFSESQWGYISRTMDGKRKSIRPKPKKKSEKYRFNWSSPILLSKYNPLTIYFGGNKLFKSLNRGDDWLEVSPDLSKQDKNRIGDVTFGTITTISESPLDPNLLYVGTDDGNVWVTKDAGFNWNKITDSLPNQWVTRIIASKYEKGLVYVTFSGYRDDKFDAYAYKSTNFGKNWLHISADIPSEAINVIREDEWNSNILYIGTDLGVYLSLDKGRRWKSLSVNLPTVAVHDLIQHSREGDLVIATHGRGIYKLEAKYISALTDSIQNLPYYMFDVAPEKYSYSININGVFLLNKTMKVRIDILDRKKNVYLNLIKDKLKKGYHRFKWNGLKNKAKNRYDRVKKDDFYIRYKFKRKVFVKKIKWL